MKAQYALGLLLALASCKGAEYAATREQEAPHATPSPGLPTYTKQVAAADKAGAKTPPKVGVIKRIIASVVPGAKKVAGAEPTPAGIKKCKNCPITYVVGDNNKVAGDTKAKGSALSGEGNATLAGKKANQATDSAVQQQAGGNAANIPGNGNTTPQTKQDTTEEAPGLWATIAGNLTGPLGYVLGIVAAGGIIYLLFWLRKGKRAAEIVTGLLLLLSASCSRQPAASDWSAPAPAMTAAQVDSLSRYNY